MFKTGILGCSLSMNLFCKREFSLRNSPKVLQGEVSLRRLQLPRMSEGCSDHLRSHWEDMVVIYLPSHQEDVLAIYMVIRRMWGERLPSLQSNTSVNEDLTCKSDSGSYGTPFPFHPRVSQCGCQSCCIHGVWYHTRYSSCQTPHRSTLLDFSSLPLGHWKLWW